MKKSIELKREHHAILAEAFKEGMRIAKKAGLNMGDMRRWEFRNNRNAYDISGGYQFPCAFAEPLRSAKWHAFAAAIMFVTEGVSSAGAEMRNARYSMRNAVAGGLVAI